MKDKNLHTNIVISLLILILIVVSVLFIPFKKRKTDNSVEIYHPQPTEEVKENTSNYTLALENNMLNFYFNSPDGRRLVESSPINTEIYPPEDIKELYDTITVKTLEEGISIFEDFTS